MRQLLFSTTALAIAFLVLPVISVAQLSHPVKMIRGHLVDRKTGVPVDGGRVWVYYGSQKEPITNSRINPGDGSFQMILDASTTYRMNVRSDAYYIVDIPFTTPPEADFYEEIDTVFKLDAIPLKSIIFSGRPFAPGSSELVATADMGKMLELLNRQDNIGFTITLIPDVMAKPAPPPPKPARRQPRRGRNTPPPVDTAKASPQTPPTPLDLSKLAEQRATAIKSWLKSNGISLARITWDVQPATEIPAATKPLPPNITFTISSILPLEEEEF